MERKESVKCKPLDGTTVTPDKYVKSGIYTFFDTCITWMTVVSMFLLVRRVVVIAITVRDYDTPWVSWALSLFPLFRL